VSTSTVEIPVTLVSGDSCEDCALRLEAALLQHRGVASVTVAKNGKLAVSYDPDQCNLGCLTQAATDAEVQLGRSFAHQNRTVRGMDCYDCAQTIERAASRIDGVVHCGVNFPAGRMRLEYDAGRPDAPAAVERVVAQLGYRLGPILGSPSDLVAGAVEPAAASGTEGRWWKRHTDELVTAVAAATTIAAVVTDAADSGTAVAKILYTLAVVIGGYEIARAGMRALVATRRFDINILMTVAVIGAIAIGAWLEAALVVVLFRIGENLEHYAVDRARRSLESLLGLAPDIAHRRTIDASGTATDQDVPAAELAVGDLVAVRPGEQIPADADIVDGDSSINQAPITGEAIPVDKTIGDPVFAGTINGEGLLVARVTSAAGNSTLDRVARAVAEAQAQTSPAERWVNSFARIYTPIVLAVATVVTVVPPLALGWDWKDWTYRGLAFLILACPCALVIATPVAVVAALSRASQAGVLVKGGTHLETATRLRAIATDKTGTLTVGQPFVTDVIAATDYTEHDVLALAAAVDAASEHPVARAVVNAAAAAMLPVQAATGFESIRGYGARAVVAARTVTVGNERLVAGHPEFAEIESAIVALTARGRTIVAVTSDDQMVGVIGIADRLRPEAIVALRDLRRVGIEHTVLLTGDHNGAATAIAAEAGITDVRADLLPGDKVSALDEVQTRFGPTGMIGDGVNDSPALAKAALGIAMGGAGSPAAIETADVVLMGDDLRKLAGFVALARTTRHIVRQNIGFSLSTKAIAAGFALAGLLPLWLAVLADVGATLLVVINGLRLLRTRLDPPLETAMLATS